MSLSTYQNALAQLVMQGGALDYSGLSESEAANLQAISNSPGLALTASIQASWRRGRAIKAAPLTLMLLAEDEREQYLQQWLAHEQATQGFYLTVALGFLDMLKRELPVPSHAHSLCQFELAVAKAGLATLQFRRPQIIVEDGERFCRIGDSASLVKFYTEPAKLLEAVLYGGPLPRQQSEAQYLLFAPGLPDLFRNATDQDVMLWRMLEKPSAYAWLVRKTGKVAVGELLSVGGLVWV